MKRQNIIDISREDRLLFLALLKLNEDRPGLPPRTLISASALSVLIWTILGILVVWII